MFKRNYTVSGITQKLAEKMEKNGRKDLKLYIDRKTGGIKADISLSIFEAFLVKRGMKKYNLTHPCVLRLEKNKGKHM